MDTILQQYGCKLQYFHSHISLPFGSLVRTLCVAFPHASDCNARFKSLSGISVCWLISCKVKNNHDKMTFFICIVFESKITEKLNERIFAAAISFQARGDNERGSELTGGAFHSNKNSGLKLWEFHVTSGTIFSGYSDFPEFLDNLAR